VQSPGVLMNAKRICQNGCQQKTNAFCSLFFVLLVGSLTQGSRKMTADNVSLDKTVMTIKGTIQNYWGQMMILHENICLRFYTM